VIPAPDKIVERAAAPKSLAPVSDPGPAPETQITPPPPKTIDVATPTPAPQPPVALAEPKPANVSPPVATSTAKPEVYQPVPALARDEIPPAQSVSDAPVKNPPPIQAAVTPLHKSILPENLVWLACLVLAGIAAALCFATWIRSFRRSSLAPVTFQDVLTRDTTPLRTPVRRANLSPQVSPVSKASHDSDSATIQE
jgi:hypothetical protein